MADLTYIQSTLETKIIGQDASGNNLNYVSADANGNMLVRGYSSGPVTPGTVAAVATLIAGQFNTALPTLSNTQQAAFQLDSSGRLIVSPLTNSSIVKAQLQDNAGTAITLGQKVMASSLPVTIASDQSALPVSQSGTWTTGRTWTLASGTDSVSAVQSGAWNITNITGTVSLPTGAATSANQTTEITSLQLIDNAAGSVAAGTAGTNSWLIGGVFNTALPTLTNGQQAAFQLDSSGRLIVSPTTQGALAEDHNYGTVGATTLRVASQIGNATGAADFNAGATGAQTLRTVANQGAPNTHANAWFTRLTDGTNDSNLTTNHDLLVADLVNTAGQFRAQSVTTSAAEALGAGTILANRKLLSITPTNGTVYWGFANTVTTTTGTPIFKNQNMVFAVGASLHVYLIAASTVDCRIAEGS